jgi:hypothetical protein
MHFETFFIDQTAQVLITDQPQTVAYDGRIFFVAKRESRRESFSRRMKTECPDCLSNNVARCIFWPEKNEWIYACRSDDCEPYDLSHVHPNYSLLNKKGTYCGNLWIESERCKECKCGGYVVIEIRKQQIGYWCLKCDSFGIQ